MSLNLAFKNPTLTGSARGTNGSSQASIFALNLSPGFILAILANVLWGASFLGSRGAP